MKEKTLTDCIIKVILSIPKGNVATYGQIAAMAGSPLAARAVVRVLNSSSEKKTLPWYRVVNSNGKISLPKGGGYEMQKQLLELEGVVFDKNDKIDFKKYLM
jgi:methylated-DNA-protein-cysteine methyltransferase related protein